MQPFASVVAGPKNVTGTSVRFVPDPARPELLRQLVDACATGRWSLLSGPMGIGKSHLLAETVAELRQMGWLCTEIQANPAAATIPFGALSLFAPAGEGHDRVTILRSTVDSLVAVGADRPHVIAVDDAPLLDDQSVAVLHQLCVESDIPLVASARNSDPQSEALAALWRQRPTDRIDVQPLPHERATRLVTAHLAAPEPTDAAIVASIVDRAGGNPLFLTELARAHLAGGGRSTAHLRDLVHARIDRLDDDERHQLTLVAVADPLDTDLTVADDALLDRLERAGLVSSVEEGDFVLARPAHPLYGEIIREDLTALRRRSIAKELTAAMIERPAARRGDALRLAGWLRACGDEPAVELAVPAALEAISWLDVDLANDLVDIATAVDPDYPALFAAGEVARLTGDVDRALEWFDRAFVVADNDADIRQVSMAIAQIHGFFRGAPQEAVSILSQAAERLESRSQRLEVESERALFGSMLGRFDDVLVATAWVLADPDANDETRWTAYTNCTWAEAQLIRLDDIEAKLESAIALIPGVEPERAGEIDLIHAVKVNALMEMGRLDDAVDAAAESNPGAGVPTGLTAFSVGQVHWIRGDLDTAVRMTTSSIDQLSVFDAFNAVPFVYGAASMLRILEGDVAGAEDAIAASVERGGDTGMWDRLWLARARAWVAAADGRFDDAIELLVDAGDIAIETSHLGWGVLALADALPWGGAPRVRDRLASIRDGMVSAELFETLADATSAIAGLDAEAAVAAADRLDQLGARWHAAGTRAALAPVVDDAVESCRLATRSISRLGAVMPLPDSVAERGLSERQHEVASAAAAGRSSKEIADELFLSVRTVDNHLRAAYRCLGVGGRADLADYFVTDATLD